jgi:hypothetical protein
MEICCAYMKKRFETIRRIIAAISLAILSAWVYALLSSKQSYILSFLIITCILYLSLLLYDNKVWLLSLFGKPQVANGLIHEITNILSLSVNNTCRHMRYVQGQLGWNQFFHINDISTAASAMGILILTETNSSYQCCNVVSVAKTLIQKRNPDGGWGLEHMKRAFSPESDIYSLSIVESTAFALMALLRSGQDKNSDPVVEGVAWLEDNAINKQSYGVNKFTESQRIFPTCLAVLALQEYNPQHTLIDECVDWIFHQQGESGAWTLGNLMNQNDKMDDIAITALVVFTLCKINRSDRNRSKIERAYHYIREAAERYRSDYRSMPDSAETDIAYGKNKKDHFLVRVDYDNKALLLLALACVDSHYTICEHQLLLTIIKNFHEEKNWSHTHHPGTYPIWATYFNNLAIITIKSKLAKDSYNKIWQMPHASKNATII